MGSSCFAENLGKRFQLTEAERNTVTALEERQRDVRRGAILLRENEPSNELYIVSKGLLMSYVLLDDGSRQILRFIFPGELIGISGMIYRKSPETLAALTECVVCPFDRSSFAQLFVDHPRVAAMIMVMNQVERVALTDRLAALGRTSAKARVAALLLEMRNRLRDADGSIEQTFTLVLTQEIIGDATGLTAVHVNRMLRQLENEGLIKREAGRLTIADERGLMRAANYVDRYANLETGWLPGSR